MYKKIVIITTTLIILIPILLFVIYSVKPASSLGSDQGPYIDSANVNTYRGSNAVFALLRVGNIEYLGGAFGLEALDTTTGQKIDWDSGISDTTVYALAYKNNVLYAGANTGLLAYDTSTSTGILISDFADNNQTYYSEGRGQVYALAIDGNTLYAGGHFTSFSNGGMDTSLAAYNIASPPGTLSGVDLNTSSASSVYALATGSGKLYVGGDFSTIKNQNQSILAAVDTTGPELPQDLYQHTAVTATIGGTTYIYVLGGENQSTVYKATIDVNGNIGAFDTTNQGQLPQDLSQHTAVTATIDGTTYIYVLGGFSNSGGGSQSAVYKATIDTNGDIGAFSATNQGQLPQDLYGHTTVTATIDGTTYIYVLGGFSMSGGGSLQSAVYKATINTNGDIGVFSATNQGQLPQAFYQHTTVTATIGGTTYIYVLGGKSDSFPYTLSTVYKATIDIITGDIGAFDTTNQGQLPQDLSQHTTVTATIGGTTYVYVLGGYDWGSNQSTVYKATIDPITGDIGAFDTTNQGQLPQVLINHTTVIPNINGTNYVYVLGGSADGRFGQAAIYKADVDMSGNIGTFSGKFSLDTSFAPAVTGQSPNATALKFYNNRLYAGGRFTTINDNTFFDNLASLDINTGTPSAWTPITNDPVFALATIGNYLYVGEADNFQGSGIGGWAQNFNLNSGNLADWTPSDTQPIYAMDAGDSALYVGLDRINPIGLNIKPDNKSAFLSFRFPVAEAAGKLLADIGGLTAPIYLAEFDTIVPTPTATPIPTSAPSSGNSSSSPPVCSDQKPGTPTGLTATAGPASDQITLSWTAPADPVTDYSITYSNDPNVKEWGVVSTGKVTSYTISSLDPTVKYYFWVNAVNGCMPGDPAGYANIISGTLSASGIPSSSSSGNLINSTYTSQSIPLRPLPPTGPNEVVTVGVAGVAMTIIGAVLMLAL